MSEKLNEHEEIIKDNVFHSFSYNRMGLNFDGPHAEDCEGCIINAEVEKLVAELNALSDVVKIVAELEDAREKLKILNIERGRAFEKADVIAEGSVADLVAILVDKRDSLAELLQTIKIDITSIANKLRE